MCIFLNTYIYIDKCMCICIYVETALAMQFFKHWFWNPQTQNPRVIEQILNSRIKHTIKSWISYFQPLRSNALNSAPVLKCSMFLKIQYLTYFSIQQAPSYKTLAPISCRHCQDQIYSGKNAELNLAELLLQTYARL